MSTTDVATVSTVTSLFTSPTSITDSSLDSTTPLVEATIPVVPQPSESLSLPYVASEAVVAFLAITGNALVVYVFCTNRSLRRYRNYYIVGLAVADFLVGLLGIPMAILAFWGLPRNLYGCLFSVSVLMVLCTISILCLLAVSIDRYWATTNPFAYYRNMTTTTAVGIILSCWFTGALIGFFPLLGWYNLEGWNKSEKCYFTKVMSYSYLVFLYFATIVFPALLMAGFYSYIYHVVLIKIRQKGTLAPQGRRPSEASRSGSLNSDNRGSTQMMRIMQSEKRREAKAAKKLGIIVLFFMLCWMPLYTINCIQAFEPNFKVPPILMNFTIILSHANSALNPFLYAYHLKEFRLAMKNALCSWFGWMLCGYVNTQVQKDIFGAVSRSQTMPSMANASVSTQTGKFSIKFRKVSGPQSVSSDAIQRISPKGCKGGIMSTTPSRDNLFHPLSADRSMTSLSLINEPLTSQFPGHHSQHHKNHLRQQKESSFTNDIKNPEERPDKRNFKIKSYLGSESRKAPKESGNGISGNITKDHTIFEADVEPHPSGNSTPTNTEEVPDTSGQIVLHWKSSPTFAMEL
ncbi:unnamed protein product [Allacma fusca]|uniref:G-protein coupled receptors family 1 profile domain-containing protein n=1 Tax=Allacma fusca TaxID=39272 RepID=A0A8J2LJ31_9HEXA|nr:unnamed protein product [Allacma fusca]